MDLLEQQSDYLSLPPTFDSRIQNYPILQIAFHVRETCPLDQTNGQTGSKMIIRNPITNL